MINKVDLPIAQNRLVVEPFPYLLNCSQEGLGTWLRIVQFLMFLPENRRFEGKDKILF